MRPLRSSCAGSGVRWTNRVWGRGGPRRKASPPDSGPRRKGRPKMPKRTPQELQDAHLIRSLRLLTNGNPTEFQNHTASPPALRQTIRQADAPLTHGLLIEILQRWHELRDE